MNTEFKRISHGYPSEERVAGLLGLTLEEYNQLSHSGIRQISGLNGEPISYYIAISPLNPESIIAKLMPRLNKIRMVYFPADAFAERDLPLDEVG